MQEQKYGLLVNKKYTLNISEEELRELDIVATREGKFHLLKNGRSYQAVIENVDELNKTVALQIGQELYQVFIRDTYDELVEKLGLSLNVTHQVNDIKAPMPGLVLSIEVVEGQEIAQGDPLLILEAMKMENVIKSPGRGTIKSILTKIGKPVDKGEILIEME